MNTDHPVSEDLSEWSKVITTERRLLDIRWGEIWEYRGLLKLLVTRDFVASYKQTILGPLWFILQPLMTTVIFTVVFGRIANLSTDKLPPFLFYLSGTVLWSYFAECVNKTANTFVNNSAVFSKVYFPRLVVPLSVVLTNLLTFALQFTIFLVMLGFYYCQGAPVHPSWRVIIVPVLIVQMAALGLGVGCIVSSLTTRYRDLAMVVGFGTQLWMYASAVVYPLSQVAPEHRWILVLNPMVPIIESFRFAFLGAGVVELWQLGMGFIVSVVIFFVGIVMFRRVEKTVADTV